MTFSPASDESSSSASASRSAADAIVGRLVQLGVTTIFALPGEENLTVLEALRTSPIRVIVTRHEQHAAFMAATWGRLTGSPGVCMATLGPGALNLLTGLAHGQLGGFGVIALTGQKNERDNDEGSFQMLDVVAAADPVTKWSATLDDPRSAVAVVDRAFRVARDGRPGAVLIEVPEDVATEPTEHNTSPPAPTSVRLDPHPNSEALAKAVEVIDSAGQVVVLASEGANRRPVADSILRFAEATGIGVLTTQVGKGTIDERHPLSFGALGMHRPDYAHHAMFPADVVITVGYQPVEHPPLAWNPDEDKSIVHIAPWPAEPERGYQPVVDIVSDVRVALDELGQKLRERNRDDTMRTSATISDLLVSERSSSVDDAPSPLEIVRTVRAALRADDIVALDNGAYKLWFARQYTTFAPQTLLLDNALATMGAGLAMGTTAALLHPERRVVVVAGDGGFLMNVQDFETAVRLGIDLTVLVVRDDSYGFIEWHQEEEGLPEFGVGLANPDLVSLASAFGATAVRVTDISGLASELDAARDRAGVSLIDCPIDYSDNEILERDLYAEFAHHFDH